MSATGSIKRDPDRPDFWFFVIDVRSGDGKRRQIKRRGFSTKGEAAEALDELKRDMHTGRGVAPSRIKLGDYLRGRWLPHIDEHPKLKPTTRAYYRRNAQPLIDQLGDMGLYDLRGDDLDRLYASMKGSDSKRRAVHVTAHKALKDAVRWRLVGFNAAEDATAPPQSRPKPEAWSRVEVGRFLAAASEDRWSALWRIAATTGMRRGELVGLRWGEVDLDRSELVVANNATVVDHEVVMSTTKGGRARRVSLDRASVDALRSWKAEQNAERLVIGEYWPEGDYVFTWPDGSLVHPDVVTRTFKRIRDELGLPPLRLHSLRHAWATHAIEAGVDVKDVATRLGHSSTRITHDIYVAPSSERDARAAETVAGLYDVREAQ